MCFVSYLLRGVRFPIHPFLRGLLEYYGLQLHILTPGFILHITGYVSLCKLFLGCEAHYELWRKLFCLVPRLACLLRKGESHPDTGEGPRSCIFMAHQSGPYHIARKPEDPLVQDSLSSPQTRLQ